MNGKDTPTQQAEYCDLRKACFGLSGCADCPLSCPVQGDNSNTLDNVAPALEKMARELCGPGSPLDIVPNRDQENGSVYFVHAPCGSDIQFGVRRCEGCGAELTWPPSPVVS